MATVFILLGSADIVILLTSVYYVIPMYLLLQVSVPLEVEKILLVMVDVHKYSLIAFPGSD